MFDTGHSYPIDLQELSLETASLEIGHCDEFSEIRSEVVSYADCSKGAIERQKYRATKRQNLHASLARWRTVTPCRAARPPGLPGWP